MTVPEILRNRMFIVVGEEHYNPLGVVRSLGEEGVFPIAILKRGGDPLVSRSRYVGVTHFVDDYAQAAAVLRERYADLDRRPVVIPCDDAFVRELDRDMNFYLERFIVPNAGGTNRLAPYLEKRVQYELAAKHGLKVAPTWEISGGAIPADISYPVITKPVESYEGWKDDYHVCRDEAELADALSQIGAERVLAQRYISKANELCVDGFAADRGRQLFPTIASRYTYLLPDGYSMEMEISALDDPDLEERLAAMYAEIGFEGIFEVEFMVDGDGELWYLETNFRNSTWSYASTCLGMNLPLLCAEALAAGRVERDVLRTIPRGYRALAELPDFHHRVRRMKMISVPAWIDRVRTADCLFFYNREDPGPFESVFSSKIRGKVAKAFGK